MSPATRTPAPRAALCLLLLAGAAACGGRDAAADAAPAEPSDSAAAVSVTDDAGRTVALPRPARRIVALLPAVTETLFAMGAGDRMVGRTDYDTDAYAADLPSVGGGLDPSLEALAALRPDLVIAWETAGGATLRHRLERLGIPVFAVRTQDTADVYANLERLGRLIAHERGADSVARAMRWGVDAVRASVAGLPRPTVLYVVGTDPPMTAGPATFVAELIGVAGGRSVFPEVRQEWPQLSLEEIVRRQPEVVIVPVSAGAEPPRLARLPGWGELRAVREGRVVTVDGDLLNRPGPRLDAAARALRAAIHGVDAGAER